MKRIQLTLFLDPVESMAIEYVRKRFNPEQFGLIPAHITLCGENELEGLPQIQRVLEYLDFEEFDLLLGEIEEFSAEQGIWITLVDTEGKLQQLRGLVLGDLLEGSEPYIPHITLMDPRNSKPDRQKFEAIKQAGLSGKIRISKISLIEQQKDRIWKTLEEYELKTALNFVNP